MVEIPNLKDMSVGEMDEDKVWSISLSYHDHDGKHYVENIVRICPTITGALNSAIEAIEEVAETYKWSDWIITGANYIPEIH